MPIPCIECNAIASVKTINAARLARNGNGWHKVSLDKAFKTMRDTGREHVDEVEGDRSWWSCRHVNVNVIEC